MKKLRSLWLGKLPLSEAFWTWAIGVGMLVNLTSSALFLAMITVGVFRAAGRYQGPASHADLARIVTIIVMLLLTVT
jgi:hypothetical protein